METFYITLGSGQPFFPGFFAVIARNHNEASKLAEKFLNGHWCGLYESRDQLHELDNVYRGTIDFDGIVLDGEPWVDRS
jgi:hypothetical protein